MADIPAALMAPLQVWWSGLDAGTQAIFEAIYRDAPAAVSNAVSGGQWVADGPEPGLAAQLSSDDPFAGRSAIPMVVASEVSAMPYIVEVGNPVQLNWTDQNPSDADVDGYYTDIYVYDGEQNVLESVRLANAPLPAGASAERSWQFSGAKTEGTHTAVLYLNADGTDYGSGVAGPQGYRTQSQAMWTVAGGNAAADMQDDMSWNTGVGTLTGVLNMPYPDVIDLLVDGVNWLAACEALDDGERTALANVGGYLSELDRNLPLRTADTDPSTLTSGLSDAKLQAVAGGAANWQRRPIVSDPTARQVVIDPLVALMAR